MNIVRKALQPFMIAICHDLGLDPKSIKLSFRKLKHSGEATWDNQVILNSTMARYALLPESPYRPLLLVTLMHELRHIWQMQTKRLLPNSRNRCLWRDDDASSYTSHNPLDVTAPHEIDASAYEHEYYRVIGHVPFSIETPKTKVHTTNGYVQYFANGKINNTQSVRSALGDFCEIHEVYERLPDIPIQKVRNALTRLLLSGEYLVYGTFITKVTK